MLVSELGQREGGGAGVLGLGVGRGLRVEFKLFRRAFGPEEFGREWGGVAPRKPAENSKRWGVGGGGVGGNRSVVVQSMHKAIFSPQTNHTLQWGPRKTISVVQLFYWNSFKLPSTRRQMRGRISYISTRSRTQKYTSRVSFNPIKPCCWKRQRYGAQRLNPNTV